MSNAETGKLKVIVTSTLGLIPIQNAIVRISSLGNPDQVLQTLATDESGQTGVIDLPAPAVSLSLQPDQPQP